MDKEPSLHDLYSMDSSPNPGLLAQKASVLLQFTTTAFAVKDMEGIILDANPAFCRMLGYSQPGLLGMHYSLITHWDIFPLPEGSI
jgi:PAS domain-containing protein